MVKPPKARVGLGLGGLGGSGSRWGSVVSDGLGDSVGSSSANAGPNGQHGGHQRGREGRGEEPRGAGQPLHAAPPRMTSDMVSRISAGSPVATTPTVGHHGGVVGDPQRGARELLDAQDGDAVGGDLADGVVELVDDQRRQPHRQLVEQQQGRVGGQRPRHREHLLLAARQRAGQLAAPLEQPREVGERRLEHRLGRHAGVRHQGEVLLDGQVGEHRATLRHRAQPDPRQLLRARALHVDAAEVDVAAGRLLLPADDLDQRGLAGAVGAEQRHHRALRHGEVYAAQHLDPAVRRVQVDDLEDRHAHQTTPSTAADAACVTVGSGSRSSE